MKGGGKWGERGGEVGVGYPPVHPLIYVWAWWPSWTCEGTTYLCNNSEYNQELSQTADKPMAPGVRASAHNHHETPGRQTKQSNQLSSPSR